MSEWLKVGKIVNTHGVRGEVRVISSTDFADERYVPGNVLYLEHPNQSDMLPLTITSHRQHKSFDLLKFDGYPNLNDVEPFKNGILKVSKNERVELEEDEFYYHDIINCEVITEDGEKLGVIKEILSPGANDVWVVKRKGKKDLLLPYIEDVIKDVNIHDNIITIHLMEGLE
ncbi:ribosome maturation factor RimM [Bacillus solimangrovi]|uniref:Ribosome maturation factor RimM n=1 Tax=Bacillus solimangrovi TaxID=1305675 RepID=A0A1E5LB61_9BACI|nr:ribosome maturation factor RimM [Bacillus solimangrovi]OEH91239.1 ribosome maturation factor RimM [Bacillus solimangrovi]